MFIDANKMVKINKDVDEVEAEVEEGQPQEFFETEKPEVINATATISVKDDSLEDNK